MEKKKAIDLGESWQDESFLFFEFKFLLEMAVWASQEGKQRETLAL